MDATSVWEVPPDAQGGVPRELSAQHVLLLLGARVYSLDEVLRIASVLAKVPKFPLDMIAAVLALADVVVTFEAETRELRRGRSHMNEVYLELPLPRARELALPRGVALGPHCLELLVEVTSCDQGWASQDNEHDGTYVASFTWSELAIVKHDKENGGDAREAVREPVTANVRADHRFRHHLKRFVDPSSLVLQHVALGDTLQLILRSQYPGWANTASYGRLRARFAVDVCEDAQLPEPEPPSARGGVRRGSSEATASTVTAAAANKCSLQ